MPDRLQTIPISGPGSWGLNTEAAYQEQDPRWAIHAENAIIDDKGVVSARKGWEAVTVTAAGSFDIERIFEYLDDDGTLAYISTGNNTIYEGTSTLTDISGTITTPTANKWKFVTLNSSAAGGNVVLGFQASHTPIIKDGAGTGNTFSDFSATDGTAPSGNEAISAFGRIWGVDSDGTTIKWCDLLNHDDWVNGSAGNLDTYSVWTSGADEIIALQTFKDYLIIFGKKEILIYTGTEDPNNSLALHDVIKGIGCIARDSVQNTGDDILFLSYSGVSSFGRAIRGGDLPFDQLSRNIFTELSNSVSSETDLADVQSVWYEKDGIYLLSFPSADKTYCFDMVQRVPQTRLPRITSWAAITPTAFCETRDEKLYIGKTGVIGEYKNYQDDGSSYTLSMRTARTSGSPNGTFFQKIMKTIATWIFGANGQTATIRWELDYGDFVGQGQGTVKAGSISEYNIAEYNIAEYSGGLATDLVRVPMSGDGRVISFEYRIPIDGQQCSINRLDAYIKVGRV